MAQSGLLPTTKAKNTAEIARVATATASNKDTTPTTTGLVNSIGLRSDIQTLQLAYNAYAAAQLASNYN